MLPGSSIGSVYEDCATHHADILSSASALATSAASVLLPSGGVFNALSHERTELLELDPSLFSSLPKSAQTLPSGKSLYLHHLPALGVTSLSPLSPAADDIAHIKETKDGFVMENGVLRALIARDGVLRSLVHKASGRECIAEGGAANQFVIFDDVPFYWYATSLAYDPFATQMLFSFIRS